MAINDEKQILSLRQFLENIVIPLAKEQHPENKFLSSITMGLQGGIQYWRPMINMSTVSQSIKTKEQYEGMANDFAKLADVNFVVDGIDTGHTIVDWIYLYNLIVNRDRFGATTFTRFFESLVPTGRVDYFAFDFANWLDNIDVEQTFENHRAEFLRYAYEDDPESDTYTDHFGIRGKEAIVEDSETFDPWDELKYNSGATDKEIEGYKQRADKLYIVPVVSVNNPSSRQIPEDFSWSGNKQKWIVTFEGSASYQVLSGLKAGDSVTFGKNTVQIQAPLRKWINDGELETVGVVKEQSTSTNTTVHSDETRLVSFNSMKEMFDKASSIPNGVITTRQSGNQHYGNPFTHRTGTQATVILPTVKDAAAAYKAWLLGESSFVTSEGKTIDISNVEPERRKWIQNQISSGALDGKTLIYYTTKIGSPNGYKTPDGKTPVYFSDEYPSHAHVLKELVNGRNVASENIDSNISAETLKQVELIFARNPKLKEVGTPMEYARYIQTIYPNSVDKSVYWHGSDSDFSEGFKTATRGEGSGSPHTKSRSDFYLAKQA